MRYVKCRLAQYPLLQEGERQKKRCKSDLFKEVKRNEDEE